MLPISVLIPVHADTPEKALWLHEAVASVREQDHPAEIIVADDASPVDVGHPLGATLFRFEERQGVCKTRNFLGHRADTEWIMFLDADDKLLPGTLEKLASASREDRAVFGNMVWVGEHATKHEIWPAWNCNSLFRRAIQPITTLHTKDAFIRAGGFDDTFEPMLEDWDYNIRLMLSGVCGYNIGEWVMEYRRHNGTRSGAGATIMRQQRRLLKDRHQMERREMAPCCGGGRQPNERRDAFNARVADMNRRLDMQTQEMVLIEYTGPREGGFTQRGRGTGQVYRFNRTVHRLKNVYVEDARWILRDKHFRIVEEPLPPEPIAIPAPVEPEHAPEPVEVSRVDQDKPKMVDNLTILPGVSDARAERLVEIGIVSFELLAAMSPALVAGQLEGVGEKTARKWIGMAKEKVSK